MVDVWVEDQIKNDSIVNVEKKGLYIVFEGVVGTGKTTQSRKLEQYLSNLYPDRRVIWTREPGGTEIAESIRKLVQATEFSEEMEPICEAYLYATSRAQALRKIVQPVLSEGGIVIADRNFLSSLAYQGGGRELGIDTIFTINKFALGNIFPDLIIYLDINPEKGLRRTFDEVGDKFEKENLQFYQKIVDTYQEIAKLEQFKDIWFNINAEGSIDKVFNRIINKIKSRLPKTPPPTKKIKVTQPHLPF